MRCDQPRALDLGARGVGLFRTEFLFLERATPPSEDEQADELEDQGGGRRGFVSTALLLVCKNPKGLGKFAGSS